jgi:hypothetical protein
MGEFSRLLALMNSAMTRKDSDRQSGLDAISPQVHAQAMFRVLENVERDPHRVIIAVEHQLFSESASFNRPKRRRTGFDAGIF